MSLLCNGQGMDTA